MFRKHNLFPETPRFLSLAEKRRLNKQNGSGLVCDDQVVLMETNNARPGFGGEKHGISLCSRQAYNFLGPGTQVTKRLARGDQPINDLDAAAKQHDTQYLKSSTARKAGTIGHDEFVQKVSAADKQFRSAASVSKDAPILGKIASTAILAKSIAENSGLLSRAVFSGGGKSGADKPKPASRLRESVKNAKKCKKTGLIEVYPEETDEQIGGIAPIIAGAALSILSSLAATGVEKLYNHFFPGKTGAGTNTLNGKRARISEIPDVKILQALQKLKIKH